MSDHCERHELLLVTCSVCTPRPDRPRTAPAPRWDGLTERILHRREQLRHATPATREQTVEVAECPPR